MRISTEKKMRIRISWDPFHLLILFEPKGELVNMFSDRHAQATMFPEPLRQGLVLADAHESQDVSSTTRTGLDLS